MDNEAKLEKQNKVWEGHKARSILFLDDKDRELAERIAKLRQDVAHLVGEVDMHVTAPADDPANGHSMVDGGRWLRMARDDLQTGFMKMERAVTRQKDW